jgi:hypothetical protein
MFKDLTLSRTPGTDLRGQATMGRDSSPDSGNADASRVLCYNAKPNADDNVLSCRRERRTIQDADTHAHGEMY